MTDLSHIEVSAWDEDEVELWCFKCRGSKDATRLDGNELARFLEEHKHD